MSGWPSPGSYATFADTTPEEFRRIVEVNLLGAVNGASAALPHLRERGGALIVISSMEARRPMPLHSAYAASKHGIDGFLRASGAGPRRRRRSPSPVARAATVTPAHGPPAARRRLRHPAHRRAEAAGCPRQRHAALEGVRSARGHFERTRRASAWTAFDLRRQRAVERGYAALAEVGALLGRRLAKDGA